MLPDENLYCVDASPSGAGVCRARVGRRVSKEIWRRGDKHWYRAPMLSRLTAALKGSGWDEEAALEAGDLAEDGVFEMAELPPQLLRTAFCAVLRRRAGGSRFQGV